MSRYQIRKDSTKTGISVIFRLIRCSSATKHERFSRSCVGHVADDVMVMYLGRAVETASRDEIFAHPRHPYTQALLSATPVADPEHKKHRIRLEGELPSPINPPGGCAFHPRCPLAIDRCRTEMPELDAHGGARVACYRAGDSLAEIAS